MKKIFVNLICLSITALYASQRPFISKFAEPQGKTHSRHEIRAPSHAPHSNVPRERQVLLYEDFEAGMPAGWQVIDGNSDGYTWTVGTTDDLFFPPPNYGTAYAFYSDDDAGELAPPGTEYLISPTVGCSDVTSLVLSYGWAFDVYDPPFGASYVRFHNGSTWGDWNQLYIYYVSGCGADTFDLTTYLPADSVQIQFTYEDTTGGWGWAFGVDNVTLETLRDHDVGVASIDIYWHIPTDTTFYPEAAVKNYGLNTETFDVMCEINPGAYSSSVTVNNLNPGDVAPVIFPDSFAFVNGFYTVTVYTNLAGDENPQNDTLIAEVWATDWQIYDDGVEYGASYWVDAGNGWGVQFPVTADWWVDSIACYFDPSWPTPGDTTATFRLYDGSTAPTNMRWELVNATIQRGVWNYFEVDTSETWFTTGDNAFFFYFQVNAAPLCPALAFDYEVNYPQYMWYYVNGIFAIGDWGGDWLMRIHITSPVGVSEWISLTPTNLMMKAPTISTGKVSLAFALHEATEVTLAVYDAIGRKCATLIHENVAAGKYEQTFNLNLAAGVYFYNLKTTSGISITRNFLLIK
ncbi:MAG: hypothetical protein JSV97_10050 [candidate division WOR-3 bacterium]|nr:MAG: hypothetical protein JSV97_10050 [candidate division WOR-3 bacterium]